MARQLEAIGASRVAVTLGAQGAWLQVREASTGQANGPVQGAWQAGLAVEVVDTVGAGDTFWGHVVADWLHRPEGVATRVAETLRVASAAAAINCTRAGCQPPTREEALAF